MAVSSVRFDNSADRYSRTADALLGGSYTMACWTYMVTDLNAPSYWLSIDDGGSGYSSFGTFADGTQQRWTASVSQLSGPQLSTGAWYYQAITFDASGVETMYLCPAGGSFSSVTGNLSTSGSAWNLWIATTGFVQPFDGRIAQVKIWTAALSQAELEAEMAVDSVVRTANLWAYYSFRSGPQTNDESGNGRTLTAAGTLTTEAGPPVTGGGPTYDETGRQVSITATAVVTDTPGLTTPYTELEWSLRLQAPAADVYEFRVYAGSTPLTTYAVTPQLTVAVPVNYNETGRQISITATAACNDSSGGLEHIVSSTIAHWHNSPTPPLDSSPWTGSVVEWPGASYRNNNRGGGGGQYLFEANVTPHTNERPMWGYATDWMDGATIELLSGTNLLIIEWKRGTDTWRTTYLTTIGQTHTINLSDTTSGTIVGPTPAPTPWDNVLIERDDIATGTFTAKVTLVQPIEVMVPESSAAAPGNNSIILIWSGHYPDYEVRIDGGSWIAKGAATSHTFTGLTNGVASTVEVRTTCPYGKSAALSHTITPTSTPFPAPIVAYNFEETGTTAIDRTGSGNTGSLFNNTTPTDLHASGELSLSSSQHNLVYDPSTFPTNQASVVMTVRMPSTAGGGSLWSLMNGGDTSGFNVSLYASIKRLVAVVRGTSGVAVLDPVGPVLAADTTYRIAVTYSSGSTKVYIDGVQVGSSTAATGNLDLNTSNTFRIGYDPLNGGIGFGAFFADNVRWWHTELTQAQVISAGYTPVEQLANAYDETGRQIVITAAAASTDQADFKEPDRSIVVVSGVTQPLDRANLKELALPLFGVGLDHGPFVLANITNLGAGTPSVTTGALTSSWSGYGRLIFRPDARSAGDCYFEVVVDRTQIDTDLFWALVVNADSSGNNGLKWMVRWDLVTINGDNSWVGASDGAFNGTGATSTAVAAGFPPGWTNAGTHRVGLRVAGNTATLVLDGIDCTQQVHAMIGSTLRGGGYVGFSGDALGTTRTWQTWALGPAVGGGTTVTVTSTDQLDHKELGLTVAAVAAASGTDQADFKDLDKAIVVSSVVTVEDFFGDVPINYNETGRLVQVISTVTSVDRADFNDAGTSGAVAPTVPPTVIESISTSYNATATVTITFTTSPVENDVIFVFPGSISPFSFTGNLPPTDWAFAFPTGNVHGGAGGAACGLGAIYHVVTAAEDTANTVTWTLTNLFAATEVGAATACYVRGVDPGAVIDHYGTAVHVTADTPHNLAAVDGAGVFYSEGLILRAIARDGAGAYTGTPAGHTQLAATGTEQGVWLGMRDNAAAAGTNVAAASITPSIADEAASITLVITAAIAPPTPTVEGTASGSYTASNNASVTFSTAPLENDVVVMVVGCTANYALHGALDPDWTPTFTPGLFIPHDNALGISAFYHVVTAAEAGASTVTYTIAPLFQTVKTGEIVACYLRGADHTAPIDASWAYAEADPITPIPLPRVGYPGEVQLWSVGPGLSSTAASLVVTMPPMLGVNDILLLHIETSNEAVTLSDTGGGTWTEVVTPSGTGTAGGVVAVRSTVLWSRYNGTQTAPTIAANTDHTLARITSWRGAATSGSPFDVVAAGNDPAGTSPLIVPGVTTTEDVTTLVQFLADDWDSTGGRYNSLTNINLGYSVETYDGGVIVGTGGGLGAYHGVKPTAGATGDSTVSLSSSITSNSWVIAALKRQGTATGVSVDGGLVLRAIVLDAVGSFSTPAGHTQRASSSVNQAISLVSRNRAAIVGVPVESTDITPGVADEYGAITMVATALAAVGVVTGGPTVSIISELTVFDDLRGAINETGLLISGVATATLSIDQADYDQLDLPVVVTATATLTTLFKGRELDLATPIVSTAAATDLAHFRETLSLALAVGATSTDLQTSPGAYDETNRSVLILATVTLPTDQADYEDPARAIPIVGAVTAPTERAGRKELTLAVPVVGAVTLPIDRYERYDLDRSVVIVSAASMPTDRAGRKEPDRSIVVTSTVSSTDLLKRGEANRAIAIVSTVTSPTDRAGRKELALAAPGVVVVTAPTDQADFREIQSSISIAAVATVQDTITGAPNHYVETGRLVAIVSTVTLPTDQADYEDPARAIPIVSAAALTALHRRTESLSVPITSLAALVIDQAYLKDLVRSVPITSIVTLTEGVGVLNETGRLISVTSAATLTDRATFRNALAVSADSIVSLTDQADYVQMLAVLIVSTVRSSDLQRYASGVVLNTALALYLGDTPVSRVYAGSVQVWP